MSPSTEQRRVLITIATGMSLRNILRTDLHAELLGREVRPVYLVPEGMLDPLSAAGVKLAQEDSGRLAVITWTSKPGDVAYAARRW